MFFGSVCERLAKRINQGIFTPMVGHSIIRRLVESRRAQFVVCLLIALLMRFATFGNPNVGADEDFYLLVGQAMHHGAIPYVDIWDRKPLGLFLIYYIFASFGISPIAYQVGAWLSVAVTAFLVNRIAGRFTGRLGAVLAATVYLAACTALGGIGGQAEIFCNLFVTAAYWLVLRNLEDLRSGKAPLEIYGAMLLLGVAITVKQTSVFAAIFLGPFVIAMMLLNGRSKAAAVRSAILFVLMGIAPSGLIAAAYWSAGYWHEFFDAMIVSNLTKGHEAASETQARAILIAARLGPLIALSILSVALHFDWRDERAGRFLILGWLASAIAALCVIPNFFLHYALPAAMPLSILSAPFLDRRDLGLLAGVASAAVLATSGYSFSLSAFRRSQEGMDVLADAMREHSPRGTALVFDGPVYLYPMSGLKPLSPLVFPNHLNQESEKNVSLIDTRQELDRILARRPGTVVISASPSIPNPNLESWKKVNAYIATQCRLVESRQFAAMMTSEFQIRVFGDCATDIGNRPD